MTVYMSPTESRQLAICFLYSDNKIEEIRYFNSLRTKSRLFAEHYTIICDQQVCIPSLCLTDLSNMLLHIYDISVPACGTDALYVCLYRVYRMGRGWWK